MVSPGSRFAPPSPDSARPSGLMRGSVRLLDWLDAPFGLAPSARPSGLPRPSARPSVRSSGFGLSLGPAPSARFGCGLDFGLPLGLPSKGRRASKVLEIDPVDSRFFTKCIGVSSNLEGLLLRYAFDLGFSERKKPLPSRRRVVCAKTRSTRYQSMFFGNRGGGIDARGRRLARSCCPARGQATARAVPRQDRLRPRRRATRPSRRS